MRAVIRQPVHNIVLTQLTNTEFLKEDGWGLNDYFHVDHGAGAATIRLNRSITL